MVDPGSWQWLPHPPMFASAVVVVVVLGEEKGIPLGKVFPD